MKKKAPIPSPFSIFITGASSGLGKAIALAYAEKGVFLCLNGRSLKRLTETARLCRKKGAAVETFICDTRDALKMKRYMNKHRFDLVFANAGVSVGVSGFLDENEDQARYVFETNVLGTVNTVWPAIEQMRKRGKGQIVLTSSLTAYVGLPGAPAYSASKAAVRNWGAALRGWLAKDGIKVNTICPGFVKTHMTDANPFPMPFIMKAEKAAEIIKRGVTKNKGRIAFPLPMVLLCWFSGILPASWADFILRSMPKKTTGGLG